MSKTNDKTVQKTPKGHKIPVPTRKRFFRDLEKASRPKPDKSSGGSQRKRKSKPSNVPQRKAAKMVRS